jgi:hypothetical protein
MGACANKEGLRESNPIAQKRPAPQSRKIRDFKSLLVDSARNFKCRLPFDVSVSIAIIAVKFRSFSSEYK